MSRGMGAGLSTSVGSHMLTVPVGVEDLGLSAAKDLIKCLSDNGEAWAQSGQFWYTAQCSIHRQKQNPGVLLREPPGFN